MLQIEKYSFSCCHKCNGNNIKRGRKSFVICIFKNNDSSNAEDLTGNEFESTAENEKEEKVENNHKDTSNKSRKFSQEEVEKNNEVLDFSFIN